MSRVIFPGYVSEDCGETVVPAEVAQVTEFGQVVKIDRVNRIVSVQFPQEAELPSVEHEVKLVFVERV